MNLELGPSLCKPPAGPASPLGGPRKGMSIASRRQLWPRKAPKELLSPDHAVFPAEHGVTLLTLPKRPGGLPARSGGRTITV